MATTTAAREQQALTFANAKVSLAGTSNVHDYEATTTTVRITRAKVAAESRGADVPGQRRRSQAASKHSQLTIPVLTLKSGKDGLDKNMYKALKSEQFPDISVRISKIEATTTARH